MMINTAMERTGLVYFRYVFFRAGGSNGLLSQSLYSPHSHSRSLYSSSSYSSYSSSAESPLPPPPPPRINVAVVGSGPSGFYSVKYLLDKPLQPWGCEVYVDLIEKMPVPFGLVRFGVAPDHQDVKAVANTFKDVAKNPRFRFFGNISVGGSSENDISLESLLSNYDAVILATGASSDNSLNIPGEDSIGVLAARSFVNWYNSHPEL